MQEIENLSLFYYLILFCVAFFAGFIDAIVGGGGLITLPALLLCGIPTHLCLATNKLQSVFGSFTAMMTYRKRITLPHLSLGVIFTGLGAFLGAWAVLLVDDRHLKLVILIFLSIAFVYMVFKPHFSKSKPRFKHIKVFYLFCGFILGFYDGFLGPATGSFWIFACVVFLGLGIKEASINTKIFNFTSNIVALVFFLLFYEVLWFLGIVMGIAQILGSYCGSKLVLKTNARFIKILFLVLTFFALLRVGYDYFQV